MKMLRNKIRLYKELVRNVVIVCAFLAVSISFADDVTLTTYYPAPYGEYTKLETGEIDFATTVSGSWSASGNPQIVNGTGGTPSFRIYGKRSGSYTDETVEIYDSILTMADVHVTDNLTVRNRIGIGSSFSFSSGPSYPIHGPNDSRLTSGGQWINGSDVSIKTNITDLRYGLNEILDLSPREYDMIVDGSHHVGLVAQEVERVIPEVVSGEDGKKGLSYDNLVAVLVKAIQQQQVQINTLKEEIETLRNR